jgi:hypothetical protein
MNGVLHVSIRVTDPRRSAEMFAELLDGEISPTPLDAWGVVSIHLPGKRDSWLRNMIEFWPSDKHWHQTAIVPVDTATQRSYCHVAFVTEKSNEDIATIGARHGAVVLNEERMMPTLVPVLYDDLGNYFEFFPASQFERAES